MSIVGTFWRREVADGGCEVSGWFEGFGELPERLLGSTPSSPPPVWVCPSSIVPLTDPSHASGRTVPWSVLAPVGMYTSVSPSSRVTWRKREMKRVVRIGMALP